jgi:hypothetical protein
MDRSATRVRVHRAGDQGPSNWYFSIQAYFYRKLEPIISDYKLKGFTPQYIQQHKTSFAINAIIADNTEFDIRECEYIVTVSAQCNS